MNEGLLTKKEKRIEKKNTLKHFLIQKMVQLVLELKCPIKNL